MHFIKTGLGEDYEASRLATMPKMKYLQFRLLTCPNNSSLAFSSSLQKKNIPLELFFIAGRGIYDNVILKDGIDGAQLAKAHQPGLSLSSCPIDFWIAWPNDTFLFGNGTLHKSELIQWPIKDLDILSVFLKSEDITEWQFYQNEGEKCFISKVRKFPFL